MATISKFYLLDAATPNTGTMPSNSPTTIAGGVLGAGTEAAGAATARDATDVSGTSNPDIESSLTSAATTTIQRLGHRRFVSRPLAAATVSGASWTFSYARSESNLNHTTGSGVPMIKASVYAWRPTTGLRVGTGLITFGATTSPTAAATEQAESVLNDGGVALTYLDGDILVFDVYSHFQQGMATAYTDQFAYNGTTEASTTSCASFVTPPVALTLYTAADLIPDVTTARIRT